MSSATPLDRPLLSAPDNYLVSVSDNGEQDWSETERDSCAPAPRFLWLGWLNQLLAVVILVPARPLILVLVAITKLTSKGPALYRQTRVGLRGQPFSLCKIRTMSNDAEATTGPVWSAAGADPRVTKLGRFLRRSHLDELPQLFNVLASDMVLIGPRPERPEFTQFLAQEIPGYVGRLIVKPGITGLSQINLPPDTDLESVRKKLQLDLEYIADSSFSTDVRILLCTALKMLGFNGFKLAKLFGLIRKPTGDTGSRARADVNVAQVSVTNGHVQPLTSVVPRSAKNGMAHTNGNGHNGVDVPSVVVNANGENRSQAVGEMLDGAQNGETVVRSADNGHSDPQLRRRRRVRST